MVGERLDEARLPSLEKPIIPVDYVGIKVRETSFYFNVTFLYNTENE